MDYKCYILEGGALTLEKKLTEMSNHLADNGFKVDSVTPLSQGGTKVLLIGVKE